MKWVYKNITIYIESDGKFSFTTPNKTIEYCSSLEEAKDRINCVTKKIFSFY